MFLKETERDTKALAKNEPQQGYITTKDLFDRWFDDFLDFRKSLTLSPDFNTDWEPKVDIKETDKEITLSASLPGVDKKDVAVEINDNVLTIKGERKAEQEEKGKGWIRREQAYGSFFRSFRLPENVNTETVKAKNQNGLLEITIQKDDKKAKAKTVSIE